MWINFLLGYRKKSILVRREVLIQKMKFPKSQNICPQSIFLWKKCIPYYCSKVTVYSGHTDFTCKINSKNKNPCPHPWVCWFWKGAMFLLFLVSFSSSSLQEGSWAATSGSAPLGSWLRGPDPPQGPDGWGPQQDVRRQESSDGGTGRAPSWHIGRLCGRGVTYSTRRLEAWWAGPAGERGCSSVQALPPQWAAPLC